MITRSRLIGSASMIAGEPADEPIPGGVPHSLRYELAADLETDLLRDENLSSQNRTVAKFPVRLKAGNREFTITRAGVEDPTFVSMTLDDGTELIPTDINITNASLIGMEGRDGRRSVAFYSDKPQTGIVSWMPTGAETLNIWYDRSPATDPSADLATFTITDSYVPLLKLMLAAQMLELTNKPIGAMLQSRIVRGLKQWEKFVKRGKQIGIVKKVPYTPGRYSTGSIWDAWPGRVPFE